MKAILTATAFAVLAAPMAAPVAAQGRTIEARGATPIGAVVLQTPMTATGHNQNCAGAMPCNYLISHCIEGNGSWHGTASDPETGEWTKGYCHYGN